MQSTAVSQPLDTDAELRALAKRLVDVGDIDRATALLGSLAPTKTANVIPISAKRRT